MRNVGEAQGIVPYTSNMPSLDNLGEQGISQTSAQVARRETPINRDYQAECLLGIPEIICDPRPDGTIRGMFSVDGFYRVKAPKGYAEVRQMRVYDVKTFEEARKRALADGLTSGRMIEVFLSEPVACNLHLARPPKPAIDV